MQFFSSLPFLFLPPNFVSMHFLIRCVPLFWTPFSQKENAFFLRSQPSFSAVKNIWSEQGVPCSYSYYMPFSRRVICGKNFRQWNCNSQKLAFLEFSVSGHPGIPESNYCSYGHTVLSYRSFETFPSSLVLFHFVYGSFQEVFRHFAILRASIRLGLEKSGSFTSIKVPPEMFGLDIRWRL